MTPRRNPLRALAALVACTLPAGAAGESLFLAKQYSRCSTCHVSLSGGGMLTAYGRSLAVNELVTFGHRVPGRSTVEDVERPSGSADVTTASGSGWWHDETFLYGLAGDTGPLSFAIDTRPSILRVAAGGVRSTETIWMRADLQGAFRKGPWTVYGEAGRDPREPPGFVSWEHWVSWTGDKGIGLRAGRFLPAFGMRNSDHTALTREELGLGEDGQVYGVELSRSTDRTLFQATFGPGGAEAILHEPGARAWFSSARMQWDLKHRQSLIASAMLRGTSDETPRQLTGGIAHGWAPTSRVVLWSELYATGEKGSGGPPAWTGFFQASYELYRGIWLEASPQIRTEPGDAAGGVSRWQFGVQLLPAVHWNVNLYWIRERDRATGDTGTTTLVQFHMYL